MSKDANLNASFFQTLEVCVKNNGVIIKWRQSEAGRYRNYKYLSEALL
jgi:hypothetical protein